jgi:pimeloyl-ACP methyl ester carboxylesterase
MDTRGRRILGRVLFYSAFLFLAVPAAFSHVMLAPLRQAAGRSAPGWEEISLRSDGLRLRGWLGAPAPGSAPRPAAVVVHGLGDSLESFTEVGDALRKRGHPVLLVDLRGHGGSEGRHVTLGGLESHDVRAALDEVRRRGLAGRGTLLLGHSMGSMAVLLAAVGQPDLRAVVVEATFDTYRDTIAHHAKLLYGLPRWVPIIPIAIWIAEWRAGFDADEIDGIAAARAIQAPLLAIVDGADPRMPEPVVRRVLDAHPGPKQIWVVPGADHVGAVLHPEYYGRLLAFLDASGA